MQVMKTLAALAGLMIAQGAWAEKPIVPVPPVIPAVTPNNVWLLDLTSGGEVAIQLRPDKAPGSVDRIKELTHKGFYNGLTFHRVIDGFMAQGGDPKGDGTGGSDLPNLKAEFNDLPHVRGTVAMARAADADSANSQFFVMLMPNLTLDNHYTVVGRVISGMQYVDGIEKGEPPANPTRIVRASLQSDGLAPLPASALVPPPPPVKAAPTLPGVKSKAPVAKPMLKRGSTAR